MYQARHVLLQDVSGRLMEMVWTDWSQEVALAAAQALGLTGNGRVTMLNRWLLLWVS